jgi:transposase-like protein
MEMVVNGVSTRKVAEITEELCGTRISKSLVSELCRRLDPVINAWKERPLKDNKYPFLIVDALIIRVREENRVVNRSMLIAVGVNEEGIREVLGFMIGDSESEDSWNEFFRGLKDRGLSGVDLIVSDDHRGLVKAMRRNFQGATWQRCQTHFMRNILDATPKSLQGEVKTTVQAILNAPDIDTARMLLSKTIEAYGKKAPRAMEILEAGFDDATTVLMLPERYRKRLRTTNSIERLNEEIRRRERVIRIFPNRESAIRLIGALLLEIDNKWAGGRRYLDMAEYHEYCSSQPDKRSNICYL